MNEDNNMPSAGVFTGQPAVTVDAFGKVNYIMTNINVNSNIGDLSVSTQE